MSYKNKIIKTTLDSVLNNIKEYDNKIIEISGYLDTQFEGMRIYADSTDYDLGNRDRSIYLRMKFHTPPKATKKKFATVVGLFKIHKKYPHIFELFLYRAEIHKILLTDASKDFFKEILYIENLIANNGNVNQLRLKRIMCFTDIDIEKVNGLYEPTMDDITKFKDWYSKNKFDISSYDYEKKSFYLQMKNGDTDKNL